MNGKSLAPLAVVLSALAFAAPAAAQSPPPCQPGQLGSGKVPAEVDGESVGKVDNALVVAHKYKIARVIELAIGMYPDGSPYRQSNAKDGSIVVSAPAGVKLTEKPETDDFRGGYEFTAPNAKSVTFTVTWVQELQNQSGTSAGECQATAQITLPVFALKQARVSSVKRFRHHLLRSAGQLYMSDDYFQLLVTPAAAPADPAPVYLVVRVRPGRALAPSAKAKPYKTVRLDRLHGIDKGGMLVDEYLADNQNDTRPGVVVGRTYGKQKSTVRFGFSISIVQGGRTLGGMRAGASCRFAFSSRANRHYRACSVVGFAKHP